MMTRRRLFLSLLCALTTLVFGAPAFAEESEFDKLYDNYSQQLTEARNDLAVVLFHGGKIASSDGSIHNLELNNLINRYEMDQTHELDCSDSAKAALKRVREIFENRGRVALMRLRYNEIIAGVPKTNPKAYFLNTIRTVDHEYNRYREKQLQLRAQVARTFSLEGHILSADGSLNNFELNGIIASHPSITGLLNGPEAEQTREEIKQIHDMDDGMVITQILAKKLNHYAAQLPPDEPAPQAQAPAVKSPTAREIWKNLVSTLRLAYTEQRKLVEEKIAEALGDPSRVESVLNDVRQRDNDDLLNTNGHQRLDPWVEGLANLHIALEKSQYSEEVRLHNIYLHFAGFNPASRHAELLRQLEQLRQLASEFEGTGTARMPYRISGRSGSPRTLELRNTLERVFALLDARARFIHVADGKVALSMIPSALVGLSAIPTFALLGYDPVIPALFTAMGIVAPILASKLTHYDEKWAERQVTRQEKEALSHWQNSAPDALREIPDLVNLYTRATQTMLCEAALTRQTSLEETLRPRVDGPRVRVDEMPNEEAEISEENGDHAIGSRQHRAGRK